MSEDIENGRLVAPTESVPPDPAKAARRGSGLAWLLALLALLLAGLALWRVHTLGQGQAGAEQSLRGDLGARIDALAHNGEQRKREVDSLRARVADMDGINKSLREELLGFGERSRHLEDAIANLAEQRLSGRDALARNEAEYLLQLAQERLILFHDAAAAIAAYGLADSALATVEDPVFASVRETIHAERSALQVSKPLQTHATLVALERVRESLATLPVAHAAAAAGAPPSRWRQWLAQFVQVRHSGEDALSGRDVALNRALAAIDVRDAEAALLARDADGFRSALARTHAAIVAHFDGEAAATRSALAELDRLAATPLVPAIPELGNALKELRNLRVTRALAQPPPARTPSTEAAPVGAPAPDESGR